MFNKLRTQLANAAPCVLSQLLITASLLLVVTVIELNTKPLLAEIEEILSKFISSFVTVPRILFLKKIIRLFVAIAKPVPLKSLLCTFLRFPSSNTFNSSLEKELYVKFLFLNWCYVAKI